MGRNVTAMGQHVTFVGRDKKKQELKKHAATIHCSNTLSLLQRKITNALLYHAYKELMLKEEHEITVKQLCRLIGYQGNNHAVIKDALKGLISTIIEWNVVNDETGDENWTASSIIASVSLEGPLCYYAYSPRMKQLLHSPTMFGKIDLVIQSRFRSSYGLALYENCIRYRGLPQTKWFDIDLFKKLMGVPAGKYDIFRDFKRRVLDKAVDEVNSYSDLIISADFVREGRRVKKIRFFLKDRVKKTRLGRKKMALQNATMQTKLSEEFGLSAEQIEELLQDYSQAFIEEKMSLVVDSKPFKDGAIENLAGYLLSALKHDYKIKKSTTTKAPVPLRDIRYDHEIAKIKQIVEEIKEEYRNYREKMILQYIESLNDSQKSLFMTRFKQHVEPTVRTILRLQRHKYTRDSVYESPQMKAQLRQFALRELDMMMIISVEEFVGTLALEKREAWQKLKSFDPDHLFLAAHENV